MNTSLLLSNTIPRYIVPSSSISYAFLLCHPYRQLVADNYMRHLTHWGRNKMAVNSHFQVFSSFNKNVWISNGLAPNRRQAIGWINDGLDRCRMYASPPAPPPPPTPPPPPPHPTHTHTHPTPPPPPPLNELIHNSVKLHQYFSAYSKGMTGILRFVLIEFSHFP